MTVSKEMCDERHGNSVKRCDKYSEEIDDLKSSVIKLTQIVDILVKEREEEKKIPPSNIKSDTVKFWQTKSFEWIIKTSCVILVLLIMAAIGMNYFKEYLAVMK